MCLLPNDLTPGAASTVSGLWESISLHTRAGLSSGVCVRSQRATVKRTEAALFSGDMAARHPHLACVPGIPVSPCLHTQTCPGSSPCLTCLTCLTSVLLPTHYAGFLLLSALGIFFSRLSSFFHLGFSPHQHSLAGQHQLSATVLPPRAPWCHFS